MPPDEAAISAGRILDVLGGIRETLDEVKDRVTRIELQQEGHAASMREHGQRIGALGERLHALETIHSEEKGAALARVGLPTVEHRLGELERVQAEVKARAEGATWAVKTSVALAVAAAGALGWALKHWTGGP